MQKQNPSSWSRREFISAAVAAASAANLPGYGAASRRPDAAGNAPVKIKIKQTDANFEREPLLRPFGFKGGYMTECWQTTALLESESGAREIGHCTQNVLWSDAAVFASHSESGGNALMFAITERALQMAKGQSFQTPPELLDALKDELYEYSTKITGNPALRKTFVLNALVGVDNAAWLLYARENGISNFDDLIPAPYRPALAQHHAAVASIPLMAYAIPISEIRQAAEEGYFFMKIKIGQPGTQEEMLEKDKQRMTDIHQAIGGVRTPHTKSGKLPYYFDANGRYEKKETLLKLLDHARKIGAFDQIAIVEEPFPEEYEANVRDLGVRVAADESAHTDQDAARRIQMGYGAMALKAIAKTMSMTMRIAQLAHEKGVPCFCADLTVNPILIDWNKNVAARLAPFPGLGLGLLETNGHQNYKNWETMVSRHPCAGAPWTRTVKGLFTLDKDFYDRSGGIFMPSKYYQQMYGKK